MTASLDAPPTMCNDLLTVNRGCGMAGFFTKLDAGITDSTIWHQPDHTRLTWITMLAMADQHGYVGASIPGLASRARVPLDACVAALECFKSPDEYSRTKDHDGRRIADADGGWVLLNHAKYRAAQNADDRRERSRIAMADLRARRKATSATIVNGEQSLTQLPQAEADNRSRTEAIQDKATTSLPERSPKAPAPAPVPFNGTNLESINPKACVPLSLSFELPSEWGMDALALGWTKHGILQEAERYRQYWVSGNGAGTRRSVKGWRQSWSNWIGKAEKMNGAAK